MAKRNSISQTKRQIIFARDAWTCVYCGKEGELTIKRRKKPSRLVIIPKDENNVGFEIDHVLPVSKGGDNSFNNLVTSCWMCNSKKSDKKPSYYFFRVDI